MKLLFKGEGDGSFLVFGPVETQSSCLPLGSYVVPPVAGISSRPTKVSSNHSVLLIRLAWWWFLYIYLAPKGREESRMDEMMSKVGVACQFHVSLPSGSPRTKLASSNLRTVITDKCKSGTRSFPVLLNYSKNSTTDQSRGVRKRRKWSEFHRKTAARLIFRARTNRPHPEMIIDVRFEGIPLYKNSFLG